MKPCVLATRSAASNNPKDGLGLRVSDRFQFSEIIAASYIIEKKGLKGMWRNIRIGGEKW